MKVITITKGKKEIDKKDMDMPENYFTFLDLVCDLSIGCYRQGSSEDKKDNYFRLRDHVKINRRSLLNIPEIYSRYGLDEKSIIDCYRFFTFGGEIRSKEKSDKGKVNHIKMEIRRKMKSTCPCLEIIRLAEQDKEKTDMLKPESYTWYIRRSEKEEVKDRVYTFPVREIDQNYPKTNKRAYVPKMYIMDLISRMKYGRLESIKVTGI